MPLFLVADPEGLLRVVDEAGRGGAARPSLTVGNAQLADELDGADVQVGGPDLLLRHARFARAGADVVVEDLGGAAGTFVDDGPVRRAVVGHGAVVRLGAHVTIQVRLRP